MRRLTKDDEGGDRPKLKNLRPINITILSVVRLVGTLMTIIRPNVNVSLYSISKQSLVKVRS